MRLSRLLGQLRSPARRSPWERFLGAELPTRLEEASGTRVLLATGVGGHPVAPIVDALVGTALWLRGADVSFLLCDGVLPACEMCQYVEFRDVNAFVAKGPQPRICPACFGRGRTYLEALPPPLEVYSSLVDPAEVESATREAHVMSLADCFGFDRGGLRLGEQARAGVIRFFGKADLTTEPDELVLGAARRYLAGAIVTALVVDRALERFTPDVVVAHHGVYVPQGVLGEVARRAGVRVVNWGTSYRDRTFIYSHGDTYHRTFLDEPTSLWEDRALTAAEERALLEFLAARRRGEGDWTWVTPDAALRHVEQDRTELAAKLDLDPQRPIVGLLTNVLWDAQLYYEGHGFADMLEWLAFTIDFFASRPELQLVIRIHPHEVKHGNRQPVAAELASRYPVLPANVHLVPHDSPFNTYVLMDGCNAVLIYGTKTGVELAPFGKPVIVAADAWIRGKGMTFDASTKEEYAALLEQAGSLPPLDDATIGRARRYAYHYFFRRMLPVSSFEPGRDEVTLGIRSLHDLFPGRDPGLDVICAGILDGAEFVFDA